MSVSTNDFKNGMTLDLDNVLFQVVEFQHVKPGKGGAFVRTKLRNVKTGAVIERTFNAGVKVGLAIVERKGMQFLYADGQDFVFMDLDTYDQVHVPPEVMGDAGKFLAAECRGAGRDARRGADLDRSAGLGRAHDHRRRPRAPRATPRPARSSPRPSRRARW